MTLGAISTGSLSKINLDRQYELAASIADRQLTMIDYVGVEDFIEMGQMEGEFEADQIKYTWQANVEELEIDNLYQVTVVVRWKQNSRQHSFLVCTRLNGKGSSVLTEESPEFGG